jgi:hypothetical protein
VDKVLADIWDASGAIAEAAYQAVKFEPKGPAAGQIRMRDVPRHSQAMQRSQQMRVVEILALCILSRAKRSSVRVRLAEPTRVGWDAAPAPAGGLVYVDGELRRAAQAAAGAMGGDSDMPESAEAEEALGALFRALRACAVPACVPDLIRIVDARLERNLIDYDSVLALAQVATLPADEAHAPLRQRAGAALLAVVLDARPYPRHDEVRSTALWGLGRLGLETPSPTVLEELLDGNPQVRVVGAHRSAFGSEA